MEGQRFQHERTSEQLAINSNGSGLARDKDRVAPLAERPLHGRVPSTAGVRRYARRRQPESTYIFTVVFCPINLIARTYPCPISAARITRLLRRRSLLVDCASGSLAVGGEDSEASVGAFCVVSIEGSTHAFGRTTSL
jgi:hypothetical protein